MLPLTVYSVCFAFRFSAQIDRLKGHIERLERELKEEQEKTAFIEKQRKDSIHNLHNNMFQKLLDAEFEYEEEIERLHREKDELNEKIEFYEQTFENINKNGGNGDGQELGINPTEYIKMRDELKEKRQIIEENKSRIFQLTKDLEATQLKFQNEEKQRRYELVLLLTICLCTHSLCMSLCFTFCFLCTFRSDIDCYCFTL